MTVPFTENRGGDGGPDLSVVGHDIVLGHGWFFHSASHYLGAQGIEVNHGTPTLNQFMLPRFY